MDPLSSPEDLSDNNGNSGLLQPLANKSVVDRIVDRLTKAIIDRELQPGQKIPTEIELCESLQVGRNSVREAIKVLVTMGVLVIRRSEGTFVTEGFSERMLDPMVYGLILEGSDSFALIELRQVFETGVFLSAMAKRGDSDIELLKDALGTMREAVANNPTPEGLLAEDMRYHRIIGHMVNNPLVDKINVVIERLSRPSRLLAIKRYIEKNDLEAFVARHIDMLRIIVERDTKGLDKVLEEHYSYWRSISGRFPARKG